MTKRVQRYGLTAAAMAALTGLDREIIVDTTNYTLVVHDGVTAGGHPMLNKSQIIAGYQPLNADLTAIAALTASTGIMVRTAAATYAFRAMTGNANEISITNPDGVAGAPNFGLPAALTFTGKTVTGGTFATPTITSPSISAPAVSGIPVLPFTLTPGGRLTLVSGQPVMTADQTAKGVIYYTPYVNSMVPVWNGTGWTFNNFAETLLTLNATDNVSAGIYDIMGFMNAGVFTLGTSPSWTNTTTRSAAISQLNGIWTNTGGMALRANGASLGTISAGQATYLGTAYMTANGQTGVAYAPAAANGGTNTILGLWNAYNKEEVISHCQDNTTTWTYAVNTWRKSDNSANNRISWIDGLGQSQCLARFVQLLAAAASDVLAIGVWFNVITGNPAGKVGWSQQSNATSAGSSDCVAEDRLIAMGFNFAQAAEVSVAAAVGTFLGSQGDGQLHQLLVQLKM